MQRMKKVLLGVAIGIVLVNLATIDVSKFHYRYFEREKNIFENSFSAAKTVTLDLAADFDYSEYYESETVRVLAEFSLSCKRFVRAPNLKC